MKKIMILALAAATLPLWGQSDDLNQQKYWYLRKRLIEKFVKVGPGHGESIPMSSYHIKAHDDGNPTSNIYKKAEWGADATSNLGWYIGVLATELKLLRNSGENFNYTAEELYYALNAIDRLDDYAELVWGYSPANYNCNPDFANAEQVTWNTVTEHWEPKIGSPWNTLNRNGFFLRMDGPPPGSDFFSYFSQYADVINGVITRPCGIGDHLPDDGFYVNPNQLTYRTVGYWKSNENSQDQIFHLLMGLMLATEHAGDAAYNGEELSLKARLIGLRLLDFYDAGLGTIWGLYNPITGNQVCSGGGNSDAFIVALSHLHDYFQTGALNNMNGQGLYYIGISHPCGHSGALSGDAIQVNRSLYSIIASISNTTSDQELCNYVHNSQGFDWGLYYLLRKSIYGGTNSLLCDYTAQEIREDLNLCPCRGPYWDKYKYTIDGTYKTNGLFELNPDLADGPYSPEFKPQKWFFPNRYVAACENGFVRGEFSGLDYMLLFNLAKLIHGNGAINGTYTNMWHHYYHQTLSSGHFYAPVGFVDMTTDVQIPNTARVEAKAMKFITLLPGFDASAGSFFLGEIKNDIWVCDGYVYKSTGITEPPLGKQDEAVHNPALVMNEYEVLQQGILENETGWNDVLDYESWTIFPNPTTGNVTVNCNVETPVHTIVTGIDGKQVAACALNCGDQLQLYDLGAGVYHLTFQWTDPVTGEYRQKHELIVKSE